MKSPELLTLQQAYSVCLAHQSALGEALADMALSHSDLANNEPLKKEDRRLLDQFAYRFTRLQDDMGARLMPAILAALGEEVATVPALDRLARLEQLEWLPSADAWGLLRQVRNEFTHDYPASPAVRSERLQAAVSAARELLVIMAHMTTKYRLRFGRC